MEYVTSEKKPMYPGELTDAQIQKIFAGASDFIRRKLICGNFELYAYAIDGLVSGADAAETIMKPITERLRADTIRQLHHMALYGRVYNLVADPCTDLDTVALKLVNGFCVVLFPGVGAVAYEVKTGEKRGISQPEVENTLKGSKDAFVETSRSNTGLIRRHLRSPDLRLYETQVGRRSKTNVSLVWLEGITHREYVERMKRRLAEIDVDGFLSPSSVEEYITGSRKTAFPLLQYTERTDRFCTALLQGRVGLLVDGIPLGYLAPVNLGYFMESPEDRGIDYVAATCIRILRYAALVISLLLPGIFVAMAKFHQQMIPLSLMRSVIESKQLVPFSTTMEVIGLLIAFELLQESGIHLPQAIGQSVSIIGGIVVGTAAVEAKLISPVALIVVSIAGVCGFVQPNRDLAQAVRVWRFFIAVLGAMAGLFGVTVSLIAMIVHLSGLTSLGEPYLAPFSRGEGGGLWRVRLKTNKFRDDALHPEDRRNQK